jgi:long-chain fatty acid transport protein
MKRSTKLLAVLVLTLLVAPTAWATNGDNLIAIGPISRAMGGTGIASPRDAISAVFANPAAMCYGPYCPSGEFNFGGTLFVPDIKATFETADGKVDASSKDNQYPIPAIGFSVPITEKPRPWRFGLAAYGVSGLGVDYKGTALDNDDFYNFGGGVTAPLASGTYTELQIMKFAPAIAVQALDNLSVGVAFHINYANLDLGDGGSNDFGFGFQPGIIYKPTDSLSLGLTYVSEQEVSHSKVTDFDGDGRYDTLDLAAPQQLGFGMAYEFFGPRLLLAADVKWINWSDAKGYDDFDWDDQWVFAVGTQWEPVRNLFLRAGYNYGKSPVNAHNGWDGSFGAGGPNDFTKVQGKEIPTYYYESFRTVGFPAVVEHHITAGIGYSFTSSLEINLGGMYAFKNDVKESGTDPLGRDVNIKSELWEYSLDFGLTWRF